MKLVRAALVLTSLGSLSACGGGTTPNQPPVPVLDDDRIVLPGVEVTFNGESSYDPDGMIVSYAWSFGDNTSAEGPIVRHAWSEEGAFAVTLTVTDNRRGTATGATRVNVSRGGPTNQSPTALITGPSRGSPGERLTFDGSTSTDADGMIVAYRWDLEGGVTATSSTVEHAFTTEGQHTVTLTVTDDEGAVGQASRTVLIETAPANVSPVAIAGPDVTADIGVPATFDGSASYDSDGSIVSYLWDLGDGTTASTPRVTHPYMLAGSYPVRLTVTDDLGATASDTLTVTIRPPVSYDGAWVLNPSLPAQACSNSHCAFQIAFPAPELQLMGTAGGPVSASIPGTLRTMTGSMDREQAPPTITLEYMANETDPTGSPTMVRHQLTGTFATETTVTGRFTVLYNSTNPYCNCVRSFDFTGAHR